jgi:hypothetical protein
MGPMNRQGEAEEDGTEGEVRKMEHFIEPQNFHLRPRLSHGGENAEDNEPQKPTPAPENRRSHGGELTIFLFEAFTQPLLDHALIVEIPGASDAFDASEHPGIKAQGDGGGFTHIWTLQRAVHEPHFHLVHGPISRLAAFISELGDLRPVGDFVHALLEIFRVFPLVEIDFLWRHFARVNDAVFFPIGPKEAPNRTIGDGFAEVKVSILCGRTIRIWQQTEAKWIFE